MPTMLQAEIAAATGTARSKWWDAHSDATQATVKNLRLHWKFSAKYPQFPNGDSYDQVSMLPRTHQQWNDAEIQNCIIALQKGDLVAVAWEPDLITEHHLEPSSGVYQSASSTSFRNGADNNRPNHRPRSDTPASVETTASSAIGHNKDLITSKHYQKVMERLRALLKNSTGYNFPAKQNTHILYDNPSGPAAYKWCFSEHFRGFPQNPPSKWTMTQCRLVEEALDSNWVSVTPLAGTKNSDASLSDHGSNNRPLRATTMDQRPFSGNLPQSISTPQKSDGGQTSTQPPEPIPALLAALNRDLTSAYDRTITSLTTTLIASASTHHTFLSSSLSRLSTELASQRTHEQSEIFALKSKIAEQSRGTSHATEAELAQARAEGDAAGQQRALNDMGDVQNGLVRSHLQELVRVRREARMEGYEAGFRAGVEQGRWEVGVREESARDERGKRLGSLFSEAESEAWRRGSEEYNPESEFGFQGHLGIIGGRYPVSSGQKRANDVETSVERQGAEEHNPESEVQPQAHLGIIGGRRPESSGVKHPRDDDGDLYDATPPRATKLKFEHPGNRGTEEKVQGSIENRLVLHKDLSRELATSFSGGLFMSSDEEIDEGMRDIPRKDAEDGFTYL